MGKSKRIICVCLGLLASTVIHPCDVRAKISDSAVEDDQNVVVCENTDWSNLVIVTGDELQFVYTDSSLKGDVVAQMTEGTAAEILMDKGSCYFVQSGIYRGFLKKDPSLLTGKRARDYAQRNFEKKATIKKGTAYIKAYTGQDSKNGYVVGVCGEGDELNIGTLTAYGYLVDVNGVKGVISENDVETSMRLSIAQEPDMFAFTNQTEEALGTYEDGEDYDTMQKLVAEIEPVNAGNEEVFLSVVNYAKLFLGKPYVWGGESLMEGVDCSGFIMKVYEQFGISLPHSSSLMRSCGECVTEGYFDASLTLPGDIICYDGHVALYIGDGKIIHAANKADGIKISEADYRKDIICVRRIIVGHCVWGSVTDEELSALSRIVETEAGGCSLQEKIYVADVVLNRVCSSRFPQNTIIGVITAPGQFQPVTNGRWQKANPSTESVYAAMYALGHNDSSMGALFFMNPDLSDPDNVEWFENSLHYLFKKDKTYFFR